MKLYFAKELVSRGSPMDSQGKQIPWQHLGGDFGAIVLDTETDAQLIKDIEGMCGSMGIRRSTEGEYSNFLRLPKHAPDNPRGEIRVYNPQKPTPRNVPSPAAAGDAANFQPSIPPHRLNPLAPMPKSNTPPPSMSQEPPPVKVDFAPRRGRGRPAKAADAAA